MLEESFLFCNFKRARLDNLFLPNLNFRFLLLLFISYLENPRPHQQDVLEKGQVCYIFAPATLPQNGSY